MWTRLGVLLVLAGGWAAAGPITYAIHPTPGGRFALTVEKTGLMSGRKHLFVFERYQGTLVFNEQAPERSRVEIVIDASSAVCQDKWVSAKDLRKIQKYALEDMLASGSNPELRFSSTTITRKDESSFDVEGTLTIRGIAKPSKVIVMVHRESGSISYLSGQATVRLKDYGLKPPSAALGTIGTRNEMKVEFRLEPAPVPANSATGRPAA